MARSEEAVGRMVERLDGLVMLSEWELALAKELREMARGMLEEGEPGPLDPPGPGPDMAPL